MQTSTMMVAGREDAASFIESAIFEDDLFADDKDCMMGNHYQKKESMFV